MKFLNPWAIGFGAAAAAVPFIVHWLTKPRPVRLPLSTIRFVRQAVQERRSRHRLRDFLVLACRTLAVLLLAFAVARPMWGSRPLIDPASPGSAVRILLVDVSQSMAATSKGVRIFDKVKPIAAKHLTYQPDLIANVILAGATPNSVFDHPSPNLGVLREEIGKAQPRPERLSLSAAIARAGEMFAQVASDSNVRKELVILSDFQRSNFAAADFSPLPENTLVQLENAAGDDTANLAILNISGSGRAELGQQTQVLVEVGNYTPAPQRVQVQIRMGDSSYQQELLCAVGSKATATFEVFPRQTGWQIGEAKLLNAHDALAIDDARPFAFRVHPNPSYLLVSRQPSTLRPSSAYYIERALAPRSGMQSAANAPAKGERVTRISADKIDAETVAGCDLIVLDHPGRLSPQSVQLLTGLLRRGKSMIYFTAETIDAQNLRAIADAAGSDLKMPVEFTPTPPGQIRRDLFLADYKKSEIPFGVFGDGVTSIISTLRFSGGLTSRRLENGVADDVLGWFSDRSAFLVETNCGAGILTVINADLATSNLPVSGAFVPVLGELVNSMLKRQSIEPSRPSGEPMVAYVPVDAGALGELKVIAHHMDVSKNEGENGELVADNDGILWKWRTAPDPGVYRIDRKGETTFAIATALPAEESDLTPIDPSLLEKRLSGGRRVQTNRAGESSEGETDTAWPWLAVACVVLVIGEIVTLRTFRT